MKCHCPLCKELSAFLRAPERVAYPWPLAQDKRAHIHQVIDNHGLPVSHKTARRGRPYTLVLTKLPALFERAAERRAHEEELLSWLRAHKDAFGEPPTLRPRRRAAPSL